MHYVLGVTGSTGATGGIRFGLEYSWANVNDTFNNTTLIYGQNTITLAVANVHHVTNFDLNSVGAPIDGISGTGKKISSMLICRIFRDTTNAFDTYVGDLGILEIDFHFMQCGMGSAQEFIK